MPNATSQSSINSLIKHFTNNNNNINNNFNTLNGKSSAYSSNAQVSNISNRLNNVNSENTRKIIDPLAEQIGRLSVYKNYKPLNYNPFESLPTEGLLNNIF